MLRAWFFLLPILATAQVVREERLVSVKGSDETWRIQWNGPPKPFCAAGGIMWYTCPCGGFAFGEAGKADLVRIQAGREIDRLPLDSLFEEPFTDSVGLAILPRWPVQGADFKGDLESPSLAGRVVRRKQVRILNFADYDHAGAPVEFFLQTTTAPCGKHLGVVIGVSAANPRLHVVASVDQPSKPLVLEDDAWEALRKANGPVRVTTWTCGDHGADSETEVELSTTAAGVRVRTREFACLENGTRGRLISDSGR